MSEIFHFIMEVVTACWSWISYLSPLKVTIVEQGELGCRKTFGLPGPNLDVEGKLGGLYFATTFQDFVRVQALGCKVDLESIEVPLKDKIPVKIAAAMTYDIRSVAQWISNAEDPEWLLAEIQEAALREALMEQSYESLTQDFKQTETAAIKDAQSRATAMKLGATVRYLRIKQLVVVNNTAQTSLCLPEITKRLGEVPDELKKEPNLSALVAMVVGAMTTNPMSSGYYDEDKE